MGAPPARPRRPDLHRPARPHGPAAARVPARGGAAGPRGGGRAALRGRDQRRGPAGGPRPERRQPGPAHRRGRAGGVRARAARGRPDAAVPDRRGRSGGRGAAPALPLPRSAQGRDARPHHPAPRARQDDPRSPGGPGLPRDRDADHDPLHPRGGARLPGAQPARARLLVRPPAVSAAVQAAPDDERHGALFPDRALLPRRGLPGRPPARVHPARPRDVVRGGRGRLRHHRPAAAARRCAWAASRWSCPSSA